ncbi:unnamed protein product [Effrenium voratum]|nr:unnamed protein product [Effrenium voratum]
MSHARLIPPPVKAFQAPYNHLRYRYPETWKRLVEMQEIRDPCPEGLHMKTSLDMKKSASLPAVVQPPKQPKHRSSSERARHRREKDKEKAPRRKTSRKKEMTEAEKVSMLKKMSAFGRRNPFGGVAEGVDTFHHIVTCYERQQRTF